MHKQPTITRAYVRHYNDNGETIAYVEWSDRSRTEGNLKSAHMTALLRRAKREGSLMPRETRH